MKALVVFLMLEHDVFSKEDIKREQFICNAKMRENKKSDCSSAVFFM